MAGHDAEPALRSVGGVRERVDGRDLQGKLDLTDAGEIDRQAKEVGAFGQRWQPPGEGEREVEVVGRLLVLGELHDGVLEGEKHAGIDVEREMQVERAAATFLGMEVDLPHLAQRVRLHEVALVMDVEAVVDGMVLQVGDVAGDVDGSHSPTRLKPAGGNVRPVDPATAVTTPGPATGDAAAGADVDELLTVSKEGCRAVAAALAGVEDRRRPGRRAGQYHLDLVADEALLAVLHGAGLTVMSEESGRTGPEARGQARGDPGDDLALLAVVDPVDGSTNASLGIPFFATSVCVLDRNGPLVSVVVNQANGTVYEAVRGRGAWCDGQAVRPSPCAKLGSAVIGVSGLPAAAPGWWQLRALGSAALELCAVAEGSLDGFTVAGTSRLSGWDYLGAMLVCTEAGVAVDERDGKELVVRDSSTRRPVAAANSDLLAELMAAPV